MCIGDVNEGTLELSFAQQSPRQSIHGQFTVIYYLYPNSRISSCDSLSFSFHFPRTQWQWQAEGNTSALTVSRHDRTTRGLRQKVSTQQGPRRRQGCQRTEDDLGDGVTVVLARCTAVLVPLKLESQSRTGSRCLPHRSASTHRSRLSCGNLAFYVPQASGNVAWRSCEAWGQLQQQPGPRPLEGSWERRPPFLLFNTSSMDD